MGSGTSALADRWRVAFLYLAIPTFPVTSAQLPRHAIESTFVCAFMGMHK